MRVKIVQMRDFELHLEYDKVQSEVKRLEDQLATLRKRREWKILSLQGSLGRLERLMREINRR